MVKKFLCGLFASIIAISSFAFVPSEISASAEESDGGPYYYFYDEAEKLSSDEFENLDNLISETSSLLGFNVAVYIGGETRSNSETETFVKDTAIDMFGYQSDTVFYYIDCEGNSEAYDYMYVLGDAQLYYTDKDNSADDAKGYDCRIDFITHDNIKYLTKGDEDLNGAITNFCNNLIFYKSKGMVEGAWYYDKVDGTYHKAVADSQDDSDIEVSTSKPLNVKYVLITLLIAVVAAIIVGGIVYAIVVEHYKFKSTPSAAIYASKDNTKIINQQDMFIRKYTTKTKIERSSGGGGGGGGGSHSGGGSGGGCSR